MMPALLLKEQSSHLLDTATKHDHDTYEHKERPSEDADRPVHVLLSRLVRGRIEWRESERVAWKTRGGGRRTEV